MASSSLKSVFGFLHLNNPQTPFPVSSPPQKTTLSCRRPTPMASLTTNTTVGLSKTFVKLKEQGKVALIPYITAGDPALSVTAEALKVLDSCGSDIIELGLPYSDPLADGPVIQAAATRALQKGTNLNAILAMLKEWTLRLLRVYMDPADVKRARRMLSNRESARRSRRRKQAQMTDLETQAGQLRVENSALLKQLTDMNHKYDNSVVDRRILEANIETLRAKVKMAEESVKRKTGINPLLLAMSNVVPRAASMGALGNPMDASANSSVLMQPASNHPFHPVAPNINTAPHHQRLDSNFTTNPSIPLVGNHQSTASM